MKVIVDTNIVFSAILNSQSNIGQILLYPKSYFRFYSPKFLQFEITNHLDKLLKLTRLSKSELNELIQLLYSKIHFIDERIIPVEALKVADELTREVDFDDVMFVALSIHLKAKIWTGDKALRSFLVEKGFNQFIQTTELLNFLK